VSERTWQAIVTLAAGLVFLVVTRALLGIAFERYLRRLAERRPPDYVARLRTRLTVLRRVIVAFVFVIVIWSVLEIFPATNNLAHTLLASGAVIALFVGVAFSVPLGNIGAGMLLGLSQPVRIGDRITVGDVTGVAEEITLIHTVVRTDEGRTAFIPNSQMVTSTVVNRSLLDPRRGVAVRLPIAVTASVEGAREVLSRVAGEVGAAHLEDPRVLVDDVGERTAWLRFSGFAPPGAAVDEVAAELRERGLAALAAEGLLPQ
jgi:small conductance mechanosensitive channel